MARKNQETIPLESDSESQISVQETSDEPLVNSEYMKDLQERADKEREEENRNPEKIEGLKQEIKEMTLEESFLQDIKENPKDEAPRLIYADWLEEEKGDKATADFLRSKDFLEITGGNIDNVKKILEARDKYQNEWWNSEDPVVKVLGQLKERTLVLGYQDFRNSLDQAFEREVTTSDMQFHKHDLIDELTKKYEKAGGNAKEIFLSKDIYNKREAQQLKEKEDKEYENRYQVLREFWSPKVIERDRIEMEERDQKSREYQKKYEKMKKESQKNKSYMERIKDWWRGY